MPAGEKITGSQTRLFVRLSKFVLVAQLNERFLPKERP